MTTIYTGINSLGTFENYELLQKRISEETAMLSDDELIRNAFQEIAMANNENVQDTDPLVAVLRMVTKEFKRVDGEQLPVKHFNVRFEQGKPSSSATEFQPYLKKFQMNKKDGWNIKTFTYDMSEMDNAENIAETRSDKVNPLIERFYDYTKVACKRYRQKMIPYEAITGLLTGCGNVPTIPELNVGGDYYSQGGFVRGEDCSEFLIETALANPNINLYRAITDAGGISTVDITNALKVLNSFEDNFGMTYVGIGHPDLIQSLPERMYKDTMNQDLGAKEYLSADTIKSIRFVASPKISEDFLIIIAMKEDLLLHGIEKKDSHKGIAFRGAKSTEKFNSPEDIEGGKLYIFPNETWNFNRFSGCVIDVNPNRADADGIMTADGADALNEYISVIRASYDLKELEKRI